MKKKTAIFIALVLIVSILFGGCTSPFKKKVEEEKVKEETIPVETEVVETGEIYDEVSFVGRVYSEVDSMVLPSIPGRVGSLNVEIGDKVDKGSLLFTIENDEIEKQVDMTEKALDEAKAKKKDLEEKQKELKSKAILGNVQVPGSGAETSEAGLSQNSVAPEMSTRVELGTQGSMPQTGIPLGAAAPQVPDMSSTIMQIEGQIAQLNSAYEQAKAAIDKLKVKSPVAGVVTYISIKEGGIASNTEPSLIVADLDHMYIELSVTDNMVNKLKKGEEEVVEVSSADISGLKGTITSVGLSPNLRTGLYPVRISIKNENHAMKPGMSGKVKVKLDRKENVVTIKSDAVIDKNGEKIVYVVKDGLANEKKVTLGLDTGDKVEVTSGLDVGEEIIVKGQNYVQDGSKVKIVRGEEK